MMYESLGNGRESYVGGAAKWTQERHAVVCACVHVVQDLVANNIGMLELSKDIDLAYKHALFFLAHAPIANLLPHQRLHTSTMLAAGTILDTFSEMNARTHFMYHL
jgi:hypothetical protein